MAKATVPTITESSASHIAVATWLLIQARHYHRLFGSPIAEFSDELNVQRKEANDRLVTAFGIQAGQHARYSGQLIEAWDARCLDATVIPEIRDAFVRGWLVTDMDLQATVAQESSPIEGDQCFTNSGDLR
jgi:hypothetical protein